MDIPKSDHRCCTVATCPTLQKQTYSALDQPLDQQTTVRAVYPSQFLRTLRVGSSSQSNKSHNYAISKHLIKSLKARATVQSMHPTRTQGIVQTISVSLNFDTRVASTKVLPQFEVHTAWPPSVSRGGLWINQIWAARGSSKVCEGS